MNRYLMDAANLVQELKELRTDAFVNASCHMHEMARLLKGREQLPRRVLHDLRRAAGILQNEAPYVKNKEAVLQMADAVQLTLDLILQGECHDDRRPGVPRVI
jgi:hypothetical protein